jgi:hypothetical protein
LTRIMDEDKAHAAALQDSLARLDKSRAPSVPEYEIDTEY